MRSCRRNLKSLLRRKPGLSFRAGRNPEGSRRARHQGKSGGARVIWFWMSSRGKLYFLTAYAKNVQEDLSQKELRDWRDLIRSIKNG